MSKAVFVIKSILSVLFLGSVIATIVVVVLTYQGVKKGILKVKWNGQTVSELQQRKGFVSEEALESIVEY